MLTPQTFHSRPQEIARRWFLVNADGVVLGRLAGLAAELLRGKGKASFSPHRDQGDGVVVINARKIRLTGNKRVQKMDFRASGYPGGQVFTHYGKLLEEKPERVVELAVYGMLPKNRHRDRYMRRLKIFRDDEGRRYDAGAVAVDMKNPKFLSCGPFVLPPVRAASPEAEEPISTGKGEGTPQ